MYRAQSLVFCEIKIVAKEANEMRIFFLPMKSSIRAPLVLIAWLIYLQTFDDNSVPNSII